MDARPLAGRTYRSSAASPAGELTTYLLRDLGAKVEPASAGGRTDLADLDQGEASVVLSPYGPRGRFRAAPAHHSAVESVGGALMGQYTYGPGPAYLLNPFSTVGQALLATAAVIGNGLGACAPGVSGLQGLFSMQAGVYAYGEVPNSARWATTPRGQLPTYATQQCSDDWIFLGANTHPFFIKTLQVVGLDEILADPRAYEGPSALRGTELEPALWEGMAERMRTRPRDAWLKDFEAVGVPAGPALSLEEALAHLQITAAGLATPGDPVGRLVNLVTAERAGSACPRVPESRGPLPLSGLRVVELAGYIAGSYAGRLLRDLGAEVVKVEPPDGDPFRHLGYGFPAWNHGKKGLALNLRDEHDRTRLLALVREADIFVTNYRPEALARMSVGRETLLALNPSLIHLTVSAFGESGPLAHLPGFDPVVQAFAGIMKRQGGDGEPVKPQMAATDYLSAMLGTIGVLAARTAQLEHGGGAVVRTSLLAASLLLNYWAYEDLRAGRPYSTGGHDFKGPSSLHGLHQTADGWLLTVAPDGAPGADSAALRFLDGLAQVPTGEAIGRLASLNVPAVPALHPEALPDEPHFADNNLWITIDQPGMGELRMPAPVLGPPGDGMPAPQVGEHNDAAVLWSEAAEVRT